MPDPTLANATWRKSTRSQGSTGNCVELARLPGTLAIRDSKNPNGPILLLTPRAARQTAAAVKRGDYNL
ncbi:DUF397 domain-containing protein [Thermomonospora cellulosilytica]|uniref:DUF397 domain-containing protein n=1 Tax=Thermomonospora cellulosilytica TaxID=1411118 RepID=A0A7W3R7S8_9ACTN|nr:DUF397 domain-containing protein [Thermomonospora cellulosilytica]MBA9002849.1 hypothetical protein [Thermomonospora cellulosilytica]